MELKKLEAKGFKSFGDKIVINFDKGITGIVGPNGCGKSNIVDAIRWVLGEQKIKNLRSDKMQNIIFNGTKNRKPLQLAEVSLTFTNTKNILPTEYSEVTTTRKYFRSGESEYQLNGVSCRLKDIQSLFADTGIGPDSYSIIELAMVDNILQNKDGARRVIFEEAAGISKFKTRKKQTLRKLEDTDADLERVEDLIFEIEKNMRSLERQARQTKRYYQLKEEYKSSSLKLTRMTLEDQKKKLDLHKISIKKEEDKKLECLAKLSKLNSEIEKTKSNLVGEEKLLSSKQKELNEQLSKIRNTESEKQVKNERLKFLNSRLESLHSDLENDKKLRDRLKFAIKGIGKEKEDFQKNLDEAKGKREKQDREASHKRETSKSTLESYRNLEEEFRETEREFERHSRTVEIGAVQIKTLESQIEDSQQSKSDQEKTIKEFDERLEGIIKKEKNVSHELQKLEKQKKELSLQFEKSEQEIKNVGKELDTMLRKLETKENELRLTQSMVDNLEGYPEAIKFLNKEKTWAKKAPLLSDIISTSEEYRLAIENYLEPVLNHYVVENKLEAMTAIELLSGSSKGKANFFLLDSIKDTKSKKPEILNQAISATEVVDFDPRYQKLIQYLLGEVLIVPAANDIPEQAGDAIWISRDAKVIRKKFSLSGGSVGLFEGKRIGRIKNLQNLKKEINKLQKESVGLKNTLENKEFSYDEQKSKIRGFPIEGVQEELNRVQRERVEFQSRKEQMNKILSEGLTKKEFTGNKIEELKLEIEKSLPQRDALSSKLKVLEGQFHSAKEEMDQVQKNLSLEESKLEEAKFEEIRIENDLKALSQDQGYKENTLEEIERRIASVQSELKDKDSSVKEMLQNEEIQEKDLVGLYEVKEGIEKELNKVEGSYYSVREGIDQKETELRELNRQKELIDGVIFDYKDRLNEIQLDLASVKERLAVEFEIDFDEFLKTEIDADIDPGDLESNVEHIKSKLEKMGPINPMALEAFEEVSERHVFILKQKEDLEKAKETLLSTIEEIDKVATITFQEAFDSIRDNFINVFRTLFSEGDSCDLKLTNPEDPLNSEIEITAKPKGKRPLTINQLSGGEKTLTATSLLFAVYLLKPAPFCIFDEVDAPLDDANIDKFNNILNEFSKSSQFIIVTHNKRTMANTRIIYGITMIENGVSKVVPVDLGSLN
jgi:chromosome segregation protein